MVMARCSGSVLKLEFVIDRRSGRRRRGVLERTRDQHVVATNGMKADGRVSRPCSDQGRGFSQGYADATVAGSRSAMKEGARGVRGPARPGRRPCRRPWASVSNKRQALSRF